jgi:hypothetical protein
LSGTGVESSLTAASSPVATIRNFAADVASINRPITTDPSVQQMPSLAVDPTDSRHLVVAYMDYALLDTGYPGVGVSVSRDGGETWQPSSISLPEGFEQGAARPVAHFDGQGRVFVSFMAATYLGAKPPLVNPDTDTPWDVGFTANNGVFVARSDDGGLSWRPAVAVASQRYDGVRQVPFNVFPDLAVDMRPTVPDAQPNPAVGNLYVTWTRYYPAGQFPGQPNATGGSDVMIAVSEDGGQTWQTRMRPQGGSSVLETVLQTVFNKGTDSAPGSGYLGWPQVSIGGEGDVYVADFAAGWFFVNHSGDAGRHFLVPTGNDQKTGLPFGPGPKSLTAGLSENEFRTFPVRAVTADPVRPGHVYVAEPLPVHDGPGNRLDAADVFFARSTDYGQTWQTTILRAGDEAATVNDDNGGRPPTGAYDDVAADQFMVRLDVNAQGDIGLVWYDTRRDPNNHNLDVFGSVSTDGGRSFSPNFRITDQSFDADRGNFLDAVGKKNSFLGDGIGLAMTADAAYVAWTDTRAGNQDIFFRRVPLDSLPAPSNDRFEPNDVTAAATIVGPVVATRHLPRLALSTGDEDWFELQSLAAGTLTVRAIVPEAETELQLDIRDAAGGSVLVRGVPVRDAAGMVIAWRAVTPASAGQTYTVRVAATEPIDQYSLDLQSLTDDLGPLVHRVVQGSLPAGEQAYYSMESVAAGVVTARLTPGPGSQGTAAVDLFVAGSPLPPAGVGTQTSLAVKQGEKLLVRVASRDIAGSVFRGEFRLELVNLDQFAALDPSAGTPQTVLHFPTGAGPSQESVADFNGDGRADIALAHAGDNVVSVSFGNGEGTFTAPREFGIGAFRTPNPVGVDAHLNTYRRDLLAADFNHDNFPDLAVTNYDSSDVSILLNRGDGTFQPQRRFDATAAPIGLAAGDVNGDQHLDLVVVDSRKGDVNRLAILLGRGDGTFRPQELQTLPHPLFLPVVVLADLDGDGASELIVGGGNQQGIDVLQGSADGPFVLLGRFPGSRQATDLVVADFTGDGNRDIVATSLSDDNGVWLLPGDGAGRFGRPAYFPAGQGPLAVKAVDWGSEIRLPDGSTTLGPPDGHPDLIVANSGVIPGVTASVGPPEVVVLPALVDQRGAFAGFGNPRRLALAEQPLDLEIRDFNRDGIADIAVVDRGGFFVIFSRPPNVPANVTRPSARDLGRTVHVVQPTLTITPGRAEAWFRLQVPIEMLPDAGDEVLDFSGGFEHTGGPGLRMEVLDEQGEQLGVGERFRIRARQGRTLFVHVFGVRDADGQFGAGAYTLVINALPQVASVEAQTLLPGAGGAPGGPTTSLVLAFRGDRLDPRSAEDPANYRVTWLGPDGIAETGDERILVVGAEPEMSRPVVYGASGNADISSGRTYPATVRQTVTLLFAAPLPAGSYLIEVAPQIRASPFHDDEQRLLTDRPGFSGHPVVSLDAGAVREGAHLTAVDLVLARGLASDFREFETGTRFLTQFHDDLGALLDALLSARGDHPAITAQLIDQVMARFAPGLGPPGQRPASLLVLVLDPVSISLVDPAGKAFTYDLQTNTTVNGLARTYVEVGGNVEVVVIANPGGVLNLTVKDVPTLARGGWVYFGGLRDEMRLLTDELRSGIDTFRLGSAEAGAAVRRGTTPDPMPLELLADQVRRARTTPPATETSSLLSTTPAVRARATLAVWQIAAVRSEAGPSGARGVPPPTWFAQVQVLLRRFLSWLRVALVPRVSARSAGPFLPVPALSWDGSMDVLDGTLHSLQGETRSWLTERPGRSGKPEATWREPPRERRFQKSLQDADGVRQERKHESAEAQAVGAQQRTKGLSGNLLAGAQPGLAEAVNAAPARLAHDPSPRPAPDPGSRRRDAGNKAADEATADAARRAPTRTDDTPTGS